jgi:hypothetical protein
MDSVSKPLRSGMARDQSRDERFWGGGVRFCFIFPCSHPHRTLCLRFSLIAIENPTTNSKG